jgi:archaellum component FlaC
MSLIGDTLLRLIQPLLDKLKEALGPLGKMFDLLGKFWTNLTSLGGKIQALINLILSEIDAWKNFKESITFRTRVISIPAAIQHIEEFKDQIIAAWNSVKDLVQQIKGKFQTTGNPTEEAEQAVEDIESSGFKTILEKFPKLAKGLEKVLGFVAILVDALETIIATVDDLTAIVNALKAIRIEVMTADAIFLKNSNPRKTLKLEDGSSIKIRVGNLHS